MYSKLISKMTKYFSELGSIIYSKACKFSGMNIVSNDDIKMYYELLNSENVELPPKVSFYNHTACCLYYLSKDDEKYKEIFIEKYLKTLNVNLKKSEENLVLIFNIIEFDKTFLNSPKENILFLYQILKNFSNFPTNFEHYLLYKYFRGYIKFRVGDFNSANKEYLEIIAELPENWNSKLFVRYIKFRNNLIKINLYHSSKMKEKNEINEYIQFLKDLYDEVKNENNILALKLGFFLFSSYLEIKNFNNCIPLLLGMKKILKKDLLKGTTMKNGIDYYLAIASRLGYTGILLDNKKAINSAIKKLRKSLEMIKRDNGNKKLVEYTKVYSFVLAILEVGLNKKTDFDLKSLAGEFRNSFLPDLENRSPFNYFINEENREKAIIDFQIINSMNSEIASKAEDILKKSESEIKKGDISNDLFLTFISAVHDKINFYSTSYISDKNQSKRKEYKKNINEYFQLFINIVYKIYETEPLLNTKYIKTMIIEIFSAHAHLFIYDKNTSQLRTIINSIDDIRKKLNIEQDIPAFGLINKIKGDFWLFKKDYNAAITYYENALKLFEKDEPKRAPVLFNIGCSYFFNEDKHKAIEYLNRCINEYNNILIQKKQFGFTTDVDRINGVIYSAKNLLNQLSN